jgi:membrane protein
LRVALLLGKIVRAVWQSYWRHDCLILSAGISYFTIFSVIPFLFLLFVIWGFFAGSSDTLYQQIVQFAVTLVPEISQSVLDDIQTVVLQRGTLGWVGIFFLFWVFDLVFYFIVHAFDRIFGKGRRRRYYRMKIASFAILLFACAVAYLFVQLTVLATAIRTTHVVVLGFDLSYYVAESLSFSYWVYFFLIAVFTLMFWILPATQVRLPFALIGAVLFVNLWYLAKIAFHWYVKNIAVFNIIYGTLGTLVVVVLWIYYSANILLVSAECVARSQEIWGARTLDNPVEGS